MKILDVTYSEVEDSYTILFESQHEYEYVVPPSINPSPTRNELLREFCRMYISNNSIKDNIRSTALDLFEIGAITEDKLMELIKDE